MGGSSKADIQSIDDAVNQSAAQLAHEYGSGRTIGALTKPDTVEMGDYDQWIEILRGQAHVLDHGYFVTKQPSQDSLNKGVDSTNARAQEAEFFQTMEPWCTELKDLSHRFGTLNLANYLASELGMLIRRRLPGILDNINFQRMDVEDKLAGLPAPPSDNQVRIVDRLLSDFNNEIVQKLSGAPGMNSFTQELRAKAENLLIALGHIKPRLLCLGSTTKEDKELLQYRGGRASNGGDRRGQWFNEDPGDSPGLQHEETPTPSTGPTSRTPRQLSTPTRKRAAEMVHGSSAGKRSRLLEASKLKGIAPNNNLLIYNFLRHCITFVVIFFGIVRNPTLVT